jgi:hypothetical protein
MHPREEFYKNEYFIHDLSPDSILKLLESDAWCGVSQRITSAETDNDDRPEPDEAAIAAGHNTAGVDAFADLQFGDNVTRMLDVGGGKFDVCRNYMKARGVELLVYDPYNRSSAHNESVKLLVVKDKVPAATSMSVLNVVAEPEARLAHICILKDALTTGGTAYFKIWPGQEALKGSYLSTVNSYGHPGYQANAYADRFLREVQLVFGLDHVKLHESIPNLIVAKKTNASVTTLEEIKRIQLLAKQDAWFLAKAKPVKTPLFRFFGAADHDTADVKSELRPFNYL